MKTHIISIILLSMVTITVAAQRYGAPAIERDRDVMQSQQIVQQISNYKGTVYTPFDNTAPSEQNKDGNTGNGNGSIRKGFIIGPDTPPAEQYPVGDAVLPLILCAIAFAGFITLRRRRAAKHS